MDPVKPQFDRVSFGFYENILFYLLIMIGELIQFMYQNVRE